MPPCCGTTVSRPQLPFQRLRQPLATLAVQRPHAFQVSVEMPLADEIRHACSNGGQPQPRSRLLRAKASVRPAGTTAMRSAGNSVLLKVPAYSTRPEHRGFSAAAMAARDSETRCRSHPRGSRPALLRQSSSAIRRAS